MMNIKTLFVLGILLMIFISQSFGKDKKTVIQRIAEADTIPVYIKLPDISSEKINSTSAGISLTPRENQNNEESRTNMKMPKDYESLLTHLVQELNANFKTTKFVAASIDGMPIADRHLMDLDDPKVKLMVVLNIDSRYVFESTDKPTRNDEKDLVSTMYLKGLFNYDFYLINAESQSKRSVLVNGGFVYGKKFKVIGIVTDTEKLAKLNDPSIVIDQYKKMISDRINKSAEKLYKKDAKANED